METFCLDLYYIDNWLYSMFPDNISLYMGKYKGVLIAGTILFKYADAVHTQYLASNDAGRSIGALDMTIGKVIEDFSMHKSYLDFGISTENSGKYLNSGLISQKDISKMIWDLLIMGLDLGPESRDQS